MKIKGGLTEPFTIEAISRAYELNLITRDEAREMVKRMWGIEPTESE